MPKTPRTVLALDPGLRELGFVVLSGRRLAAHGVAQLWLGPKSRRVAEARSCLLRWLRTYKPKVVVLERTNPHPTGSFDRLHRLGLGLRRMCRRRGIPTATYPTQTVRKAVVGNGNATKREVARVLADRFPALRVYLAQDKRWKERHWQNMFDALSLAVFHQGHNPPSRSRPSG